MLGLTVSPAVWKWVGAPRRILFVWGLECTLVSSSDVHVISVFISVMRVSYVGGAGAKHALSERQTTKVPGICLRIESLMVSSPARSEVRCRWIHPLCEGLAASSLFMMIFGAT